MARKIEIPSLSATEVGIMEKTLEERLGQHTPVELGNTETCLHRHKGGRELTIGSIIHLKSPGNSSKNFIGKTRENKFSYQFFYHGYQASAVPERRNTITSAITLSPCYMSM